MIQTHSSAGIAQNPMLCDVDSYKTVLELFRCKDEKRKDWLLKPFVIGENVFTTDAHCMVWLNVKNVKVKERLFGNTITTKKKMIARYVMVMD